MNGNGLKSFVKSSSLKHSRRKTYLLMFLTSSSAIFLICLFYLCRKRNEDANPQGKMSQRSARIYLHSKSSDSLLSQPLERFQCVQYSATHALWFSFNPDRALLTASQEDTTKRIKNDRGIWGFCPVVPRQLSVLSLCICKERAVFSNFRKFTQNTLWVDRGALFSVELSLSVHEL